MLLRPAKREMGTLDPIRELLLIDFQGSHARISMPDQIPKGIQVCGGCFANDECHRDVLEEVT